MDIGGLVAGTHLKWSEPRLQVGDRIEVRIVDAESPDAPMSEHRDSAEAIANAERAYYEFLKKKYGDR